MASRRRRCGADPGGGLRAARPTTRSVGATLAVACGRGRAPPLRTARKTIAPLVKTVIAKPVRTLTVGSEPSAASGRISEVNEWLRAKFQASAVRQHRNFGHRNRNIRIPISVQPRIMCI